MQALLNNLSDIGIGTGLLAVGGQTYRERSKLGSLLRTGLWERQRLALPLSVLAIAFQAILLVKAGSESSQVALLSVALLVYFFFQYQISVFAVALRLHQRVAAMQKLDIHTSALRLVLTASFLYLLPSATLAILAVILVFIIQLYFYQKWTFEVADLSQPRSNEYSQKLRSVMRSMTPMVIFQCVQSQIPIFLLTLMGQMNSVAEYGALSRLAVLFTIFGALNFNIMQPSYARLTSRRSLIAGFWLILCLNILIGISFVIVSIVFPTPLLWLLGANYQNLDHELVIAVIGAALSLLSGAVWGMVAARGWVQKSWLLIPATIAGQIFAVLSFDLTTLKGVLFLNIAGQTLPIVAYLFILFHGLRKLKSEAV